MSTLGTIFLILIPIILLASIEKALHKISHSIDSKPIIDRDSLSGIKNQIEELCEELHKITIALGGEEKIEEQKKKHRQELKKRLVSVFMKINKKTEREAKKEASKLLEDAEFEETYEKYPDKYSRIEDWVKQMEKDEIYKTKYGHLLGKVRSYVKDKTEIKKSDEELYKLFGNVDYNAKEWIMSKMKREGLVYEIEEDTDYGTTRVTGWKVIAKK